MSQSQQHLLSIAGNVQGWRSNHVVYTLYRKSHGCFVMIDTLMKLISELYMYFKMKGVPIPDFASKVKVKGNVKLKHSVYSCS